ncbi:unnamed protein product, partial [Meganyctiphanes norvegica]
MANVTSFLDFLKSYVANGFAFSAQLRDELQNNVASYIGLTAFYDQLIMANISNPEHLMYVKYRTFKHKRKLLNYFWVISKIFTYPIKHYVWEILVTIMAKLRYSNALHTQYTDSKPRTAQVTFCYGDGWRLVSNESAVDFKYITITKLKKIPQKIIKGHKRSRKVTKSHQWSLKNPMTRGGRLGTVSPFPRDSSTLYLSNLVLGLTSRETADLAKKSHDVGLDNTTDLDTRLSYVTTEVLVQKLIHRKTLNDYTHIILDEVHERDEHTDFALLVVKKLLFTNSRSVKVILMSATIDSNKFSQYFRYPVMGSLYPAPIIAVSKPIFQIQEWYRDQLGDILNQPQTIIPRCMTTLPPVNLDEPGISDEMYNFVRCLIHGFDILERDELNIEDQTKLPEIRGAVLAFLPGLMEIEKLIEELKQDYIRYKWHVIPLHSSITSDEQRKVFAKVEPNVRKIIVSTNIAESSITVEDVKYVIDFCLTKNLTCDPVTNYTSLKMSWTSKSSCDQRRGRCGRTSDGRLYRLVDRDYYQTFSQYSVPELCRTPLTHVVLKTKVLDMGEPQSLLALAMDPPQLHDIHRTILTLKQVWGHSLGGV